MIGGAEAEAVVQDKIGHGQQEGQGRRLVGVVAAAGNRPDLVADGRLEPGRAVDGQGVPIDEGLDGGQAAGVVGAGVGRAGTGHSDCDGRQDDHGFEEAVAAAV